MSKRPAKFLYSETHDDSLYPKSSKKRAARKPVSPPQINNYGPPPETNIGFLGNLSDEQRRELRARQLVKASSPDRISPPLPDHDIQYDPDLKYVSDPRGDQYNQVDGKTVFPNVNGPMEHYPRTLLEREIHPPLRDVKFDPKKTVNAHLKSIVGAVSADDHYILSFDNKMTDVQTALVSLRQAAESMAEFIERQDDNPSDENSPTTHAKNIVQFLSSVIEPWFSVVDQEFTELLSGTIQSEELENQNNSEEEPTETAEDL